MKKIPKAKEFFEKGGTYPELAIEFTKFHVIAALQIAKDEVAKDRLSCNGLGLDLEDRILNAYPLSNIK